MYSLPLTSHTCPPLPSAMITSCVTLPKPPPGSTPRAVSTSPRSSSLNVCAGIGRSLHGFAVALVLPWPGFCLGRRPWHEPRGAVSAKDATRLGALRQLGGPIDGKWGMVRARSAACGGEAEDLANGYGEPTPFAARSR